MPEDYLLGLEVGEDGIYSYTFDSQKQQTEVVLRQSVAEKTYRDHEAYFTAIAKSHSIQVMDREVELFLAEVPENGLVIDVGGCWGWHWRNLPELRPDVKVVIVDFVKANLHHAKAILGKQINRSVYLVHGDATNLIFKAGTFDGYWSVQTLQHIPDFKHALIEAYRVLKNNGIFANYSLNNQLVIRWLYALLGRHYHVKGTVDGCFYLELASSRQVYMVEDVFHSSCTCRYTEVLFSPELKIRFPRLENSLLGKVDRYLSSPHRLFPWVARQQSYHVAKH